MGGRFNCMELPEPDFYSMGDLEAMTADYVNIELAAKRGNPSVIWRRAYPVKTSTERK